MSVEKYFIVILCALVTELGYAGSSRVTLTSNAYSNLVVAISPDIPKTDANVIINNIQVSNLDMEMKYQYTVYQWC